MDADETGRSVISDNVVGVARDPARPMQVAPLAHSAEHADAPPKERLNVAAHGLRGLASLMVVAAHIVGGTARHVYPNDAAYVAAVQHPWYLGTFGVELFFVISGFVILPSALKYRPSEFALRRFLRLYPLFFVLSLLFVALNHFTGSYEYNNNLKSVVSGLLFINLLTGTEQLTPNAWSLSFEVMFYVFTCAIVHFTVRRPLPALAAVAIALALWFFVTYPITVYFIAGAAIRLASPAYKFSILARRCLESAFFILMVIFASRGHFEYTQTDLTNPLVISIIITTTAYFYFAVSPKSLTGIVMDNSVPRYLGTVSYSLYLVHPYAYYVVRMIFLHEHWFTADAARSVGLFFVCVVVLSIVVSHFVHLTLERMPYEWAFHQRIYGRVTRKAEPAAPPVAGLA